MEKNISSHGDGEFYLMNTNSMRFLMESPDKLCSSIMLLKAPIRKIKKML